ncbi:hypothetical protein JCM5350_005846 [Sporobolomyces pararoseus]
MAYQVILSILHQYVFKLSKRERVSKRVLKSVVHNISFNSRQDYKNDVFPPHVMTGVDKLHQQGVLGDGPASESSIPVSITRMLFSVVASEMVVTCHMDRNEHGTHVSGIIGALANNYGFSGVAPHADLGMYRVFGCEGSAADDIFVNALLQSISDNCDIVSFSLGGSAGWIDQYPSQIIVERMNNLGIIRTISAGNDRSEGLFYANGPSATRTGISVGSVDVTKLPAYNSTILGNPAHFLTSLPSLSTFLLSLPTCSTSTSLRPILPSRTMDVHLFPIRLRTSQTTLPSFNVEGSTFDQKMTNVAAKGGIVMLVYYSATASSSVPYLTPDGTGIVAVGSLRREEGLRLLSYYKTNAPGLRIASLPTTSLLRSKVLSLEES